jgi:dolichol kinase
LNAPHDVDTRTTIASDPSRAEAIPFSREVARKAIHFGTALVPILYAVGWPRLPLLLVVASLSVIAVLVELARSGTSRISTRISHWFLSITGPLLRAHERRGVSGATWLLVAFALALAIYPKADAIAAMWAVSVGDAGAALGGRAWQRWRTARGVAKAAAPTKSWAGTTICFLLSALGAWLLAGLEPSYALAVGAAAALAERPRGPLDDNLRIVLAVRIAILLCRLAFTGAIS